MSSIQFFFEDVEIDNFNQTQIERWITECIANEGFNLGDINYIFCSDNYLLEINKSYLNHDYHTDIITFNYNDNQTVNSDIYISTDRVLDNSKTYKVNFIEELNRVIVHGVLHLVGYNDKSLEEQAIMRSKEDFYLALYSQTMS